MSAIGHTMATMSRNGGKPGVGNSDGPGENERGGRKGNGNGNRNAGHNANAAARGQNINHLLSFTLPPRISNSNISTTGRRPKRGGGQYIPFNKERYVNAQYRFLVKPTGDYTAYFADSDIFLNWSDILTVLIPTTSALSTASHVTASSAASPQSLPSEMHEGATCPICLSPPTAPRMTKCGHVYCYPCILHYLTVNDAPLASGSTTPTPYHHHVPGAGPPRSTPTSNAGTPNGLAPSSSSPKWKRCPVCWDAVYARDVKAVKWWDPKARAEEFERDNEQIQEEKFASVDQLCMRLIERPHLTTLALPLSSTWPTASTSTSEQPLIAQHAAPWHFQPDVMTFSKFMLATPDFLLSNLHADLEQLNEERMLLQSFLPKDEASLTFVAMAERKVHEQMEKVTNELDTQSVRSRIGFARKELAEHYEMEKGNKERNAEAISRRQRKRIEKEKKESVSNEFRDGLAEQPASGAVDDNEGTQEFLAIRSQGQGGIVLNPAVTPATPSDNDADDKLSVVKENKATGHRTRRNLNPPAPLSSSFFFYQASSGQNIFIHPLDIKVLLSAYGSYAAFPSTLQVSVQGADEGSMNEEMRKRCKYLTHLSKGADIVFVEVDWDRMVKEAESRGEQAPVSRSVLKVYDQALRQRRNRRRDRERREDRAKLRSEEQERVSRPLPSSAQPIGIGGLSRSPVLAAYTDFGSSLGSQSALSPTLQEALLHAGPETGLQSDEDFPEPRPLDHSDPLGSEDGEYEEHGTSDASGPGRRRSARLGSSHNKPLSTLNTTTVWGTPTARGSFANALHHSSRAAATAGHAEDDRPDWDAWLELEEDFIVGARNNPTIREGKGLNKQAKKGESTGTTHTPPSNGKQQTGKVGQKSSDEEEDRPVGQVKGEEQHAAAQEGATTPRSTPGKQQKKKKLVLTSGGGGRGTR